MYEAVEASVSMIKAERAGLDRPRSTSSCGRVSSHGRRKQVNTLELNERGEEWRVRGREGGREGWWEGQCEVGR